MDQQSEPKGELAIRTLAMPSHTNPNGDIFGGWIVSQMDLAGLYVAKHHVPTKLVTVAIDSMEFLCPVHVGDFVCCYADIIKLGRTSLDISIETWVRTSSVGQHRKVTNGHFIYVAVDDNGRPEPLINR